uniref:Uncharacterized protein n=1 Tax=Avena sativa TaxID=4498 RepID=A0ACD5U007_AVESA
MAFFDTEMKSGQVVSGISADTILIQDAIGEKVGKFLQLLTTFLGSFVLAFIKGWLLTLVMLSTTIPLIVAYGFISKTLSKISTTGLASYSDAGDIVEQTLGSIRTVGRLLMLQSSTTNPALINQFSCYNRSLGDAAPCIVAFEEGRGAAYRLFKTINRKLEIDYNDTTGVVLEDIKGDVELRDVSFSYPSRPEQLIFGGFSIHVSSGTTMAIVGESGSGKSTVINLVERFYDPQAGEVLIDGMNIKSFKLAWIRGKIGLVNQEPLLFMTSIKENITYGKDDATLEEIKRAAELANAAQFIENLPNGYETAVGQRGAQLSGGQKQRIAVARAILKNPKILLLDEATSALDLKSERVVQEALNKIMAGRTTVVVAHRLSTVRNAHCISVVSGGKIIEQGHHDILVKDPAGAYSQLIQLQEAQEETSYQLNAGLSGPLSKRNQSQQLISRSSAGSSHHSLNLPVSLPSPTAVPEYDGANGEKQNETTDGKGYAQVKFLEGFSQDAKTVALVGQSGSGKSTVIALLERFYDPDSGVILLDGVEIKKLKLRWLRDQMGLVSQEPVLFNDTIRANIAYGKHEVATEEEIAVAAKAANAHVFISSMPQGYNTIVGERGTQLSGGQKQRIAIARAILRDPRILLLDEATSALDAESERIVQDALDGMMVGRTTVIVAHRLSTIQGADIIAVLKDGAIAEKGTHEILMGIDGGAYASFVELRPKGT